MRILCAETNKKQQRRAHFLHFLEDGHAIKRGVRRIRDEFDAFVID